MYSLDLTAGYGKPNNEDMQHYHFMIDAYGKCYEGYHKVEDNIDCKDNDYAQHCAEGNTGTIGISACGMAGFKMGTLCSNSNLTRVQMESLFKKCAEECIKYGIEVTPDTVYTHAEYDITHAKHGKIDIVYIPYLSLCGREKVGDYIRGKVQWYIDNSKAGDTKNG